MHANKYAYLVHGGVYMHISDYTYMYITEYCAGMKRGEMADLDSEN